MTTTSYYAAAGCQCDLAAATCHASMFLLPLEAFSRFWATLLSRSQATQAHRHLNSLATPWWTLKGTLLLNSAAANSNPGIASKARVYYAKLVELHDNATKRFTSSFYTTATLSILTDQDKLLESPRHIWLSSSSVRPVPASRGPSLGAGYLAILDSLNNGLPSNQIMAMKIDTLQKIELSDPSSCHIAVLTHSITHDPAASISDYCVNHNSSWCSNNCIQFSTPQIRTASVVRRRVVAWISHQCHHRGRMV